MLRDYQSTLKNKIYAAWAAMMPNVCAVAPCGAGKTVIMSDIAGDHIRNIQFIIAHRQELVGQISMALCRAGIIHRIIAPPAVIGFIVSLQIETFGRSFYNDASLVCVAGVDTLNRRLDALKPLLQSAKLKQIDEGHHVLEANKWGAAWLSMPNAVGIGWTATPKRADRRALLLGEGGCYQALVEGPTPRWLIDSGYLADYRIVAAREAIATAHLDISSSTGDFNATQLREEAHRSAITGDVVGTYLKFTPGKRGVTFCVDVELAKEQAAAFTASGVPAGVLHAKTPDRERAKLISDFACGFLREICNVDVLGEGYDCPGIEVASLARPTASMALAVQQMMRPMRPADGKTHAWILDHVGNVIGPRGHGLPDKPRVWSLGSDSKRRPESDEEPLQRCLNVDCLYVWEGWDKTCPECGWVPVARERSGRERPEQVEGDLFEVGPEVLEQLRKEAQKAITVGGRLPHHMGNGIVNKVRDAQQARADAQMRLRDVMGWWAGLQKHMGYEDSISYKRFYKTFGIDVATAKTLDRAGAEKLTAMIEGNINANR